MKKLEASFAIIIIVDLFRIPEELIGIIRYLKNEFDIKDLIIQDFVSTCRSNISNWNFGSTLNLYKENIKTFL